MSTEDDTFNKLRRVPFSMLTFNKGEHFDESLKRQGWSYEEWTCEIKKQTGRLLANVD